MATPLLAKIRVDDKDVHRSVRGIESRLKLAGKVIGLGASAAVAGGLAKAVGGWIDYDKALRTVAAVSSATGKELAQLDAKATALGKSTVFSSVEVANGMAFLARAGLDAGQVMTSIGPMLSLAAAGGLELADAADIATNVMSSFGLEVSELGRVSDVFAKAAASSNTTVGQLGQAFSFIGPIAKELGLSIEDTAAAIGTMSNNGIQGARAGTSLKSVLASLIKPTREGAKVLRDLGVATVDAEGNMRPFNDIMKDLNGSGIKTAQAITLFNNKMAPAALAMIRGADATAKLKTELDGAEGSAAKMAKVMSGGIYGDSKRLESAMSGLGKAIGDTGLQKDLADVLVSITGFINKLSDVNPGIVKFTTLIAGIAAVLIPLALVAGGPITLAIAAIAALVAAYIAFKDDIHAVIDKVIVKVKKIGTAFSDAFTKAGNAVTSIGNTIKKTVLEMVAGIFKSMEKLPLIGKYAKEAKEKVLAELSEMENEAVGNSIVPDMVKAIDAEMAKMPLSMQAHAKAAKEALLSELADAENKAPQHVAAITADIKKQLVDLRKQTSSRNDFLRREKQISAVEFKRRELIAENNILLEEGVITQAEFEASSGRINERWTEQGELVREIGKKAEEYAGQLSDGLVDAFVKGESAGEAFKSTMLNIISDIGKSLIKSGISQIFGGGGGGGGGGLFSSIFKGIGGLFGGGGGGIHDFAGGGGAFANEKMPGTFGSNPRDVVPAMIRRDESVLKPDSIAALRGSGGGSVVNNITNFNDVQVNNPETAEELASVKADLQGFKQQVPGIAVTANVHATNRNNRQSNLKA